MKSESDRTLAWAQYKAGVGAMKVAPWCQQSHRQWNLQSGDLEEIREIPVIHCDNLAVFADKIDCIQMDRLLAQKLD